MDILTLFSQLGLPGWLVIIAAILVILRATGVLEPIVAGIQNYFESSAAKDRTEQIAVWKQVTDLQSQTLNQNKLLLEYIINDIKETLIVIKEEQTQQKYHSREIDSKLSLLIQIFSDWYDQRGENIDKRDMAQTQTITPPPG